MKEINSAYLEKNTIGSIRKAWNTENNFKSLVLKEFLSNDFYESVRKEIAEIKLSRDVIRTTHSFSVGKIPKSLKKLVQSKEFSQFIKQIINLKLGSPKDEKTLSFGWKDYTILNDKFLEKPGVDLIFDFTEGYAENFGGQIVYVDGTGDYTPITPDNNSFILARREKGTQKFVKYINHLSNGKKRTFVIFSF